MGGVEQFASISTPRAASRIPFSPFFRNSYHHLKGSKDSIAFFYAFRAVPWKHGVAPLDATGEDMRAEVDDIANIDLAIGV